MPELKINTKTSCNHSTSLFPLFKTINYCFICSIFSFLDSSSCLTIKTIKPSNYMSNKEPLRNLLWALNEKENKKSFVNKKEYMKYRTNIIKNIKKLCQDFSFSLKTYFLSIEYLDNICSKIISFNPKTLFQISLICLILAAKFNEQTMKAQHFHSLIKHNISKNYLADEIYILQLLDYKLNIITPYDILKDILNCGFVFEGENYDCEKMNYIYSKLETILFIFSERNSYISMTTKQIAISFIGFARELMNLIPYNNMIKKIFLIDPQNELSYINGLKTIKKKIKIEDKINNQNETNSNKIPLYCKENKKIGEN